MKGLRVNFDYETNKWFVESPIALDPVMRQRVITYVKPIISLRITREGKPERRLRMREAFDNLSPQTLEVRLEGKGEKTIYLAPGEKY